METVHHGWIGYFPDDRNEVRAGVSKVPFGLLPFAAHNFWSAFSTQGFLPGGSPYGTESAIRNRRAG
ncbi:MAG: hypothetical protein ACLFO5_05860 [Opitutales bacterium]